jgi:hypothetical protein
VQAHWRAFFFHGITAVAELQHTERGVSDESFRREKGDQRVWGLKNSCSSPHIGNFFFITAFFDEEEISNPIGIGTISSYSKREFGEVDRATVPIQPSFLPPHRPHSRFNLHFERRFISPQLVRQALPELLPRQAGVAGGFLTRRQAPPSARALLRELRSQSRWNR